jgi:hypothetical protein
MEYLRGWRVMREDPEWIGKMGVACLLILAAGCIPVVPTLMLYGWQGLMLRRAVSGQSSPMPRLDLDFNYLMKLLNGGFKVFLARMLWSMPVVAVAMVFVCCVYAGMIGSIGVIGAAGSEGGEGGALLGTLGTLCVFCVSMVLYLVLVVLLSMPMQIAVTRAELTDDLSTAMRFGEVMAMTKLMFRELLIGNLVMMGVSLVIAFFGIITFYLGLFPGMFVMVLIMTHWQAQLYQRYLDKGGAPLKIGPLDVEIETPVKQQPAAY